MFQMFVRMLLFFSDTDDIPPQRKSKTFWCCALRIYQLFKNNLRKLNICYLSGEMHDIFVGLMGRRSADPGNRLSLSLLTFDKNSVMWGLDMFPPLFARSDIVSITFLNISRLGCRLPNTNEISLVD